MARVSSAHTSPAHLGGCTHAPCHRLAICAGIIKAVGKPTQQLSGDAKRLRGASKSRLGQLRQRVTHQEHFRKSEGGIMRKDVLKFVASLIGFVLCIGLVHIPGILGLVAVVGLCLTTGMVAHYFDMIRYGVVARRARRRRYREYLDIANLTHEDVDFSSAQILRVVYEEAQTLQRLFMVNQTVQKNSALREIHFLVYRLTNEMKQAFWARVELVKEFNPDRTLPTT